jgi:helix-turn-helix protein
VSIAALHWAWRQKLAPVEKLVLLALADHADDEGMCWPGQRGVADKCGLSRQTVAETIARLHRLGLMTGDIFEGHYRRPSRLVPYLLVLARGAQDISAANAPAEKTAGADVKPVNISGEPDVKPVNISAGIGARADVKLVNIECQPALHWHLNETRDVLIESSVNQREEKSARAQGLSRGSRELFERLEEIKARERTSGSNADGAGQGLLAGPSDGPGGARGVVRGAGGGELRGGAARGPRPGKGG